jgi:hypothetical protein
LRFGNVVFKFQLLGTAVLMQHHCPHLVSPTGRVSGIYLTRSYSALDLI